MPPNDVQDDQTIADDEPLWRRIFDSAIVRNEENNEFRAQSGAIRDHSGPTSVDIASLTTPEESLRRGLPGMLLVEFRAKTVRDAGCKIKRDPLPGNPAHALIYGNHANGGLSSAQAQKIARKSRILMFER